MVDAPRKRHFSTANKELKRGIPLLGPVLYDNFFSHTFCSLVENRVTVLLLFSITHNGPLLLDHY